MGIWDKIKGEFIDVVEWTQPSNSDLLAYRFPRHNNEIKMGAKLTVREGQAAVFVNEGKIADVFAPGMYELSTNNLPILSTLKGWKHGFQSPFKAEVYFVSTVQQTDHRWGTTNPLIKRDQDFGMVRLRGHGSYVFRVVDPARFLRELVATDPEFEDFEIDSQLRQVIVAEFAKALGQTNIPILDLLASYEQLSQFVMEYIKDDFEAWGLELTKFYIQSVTVPPAVEEAMDRRSAMGVVGDLSRYTQYQTAEAIREASNNPSGGAAAMGAGLGAGMAMANQMASSLGGAIQGNAGAGTGTPPPLPNQVEFHVALEGRAQGPFPLNQVLEMVQKGQVQRETLVWTTGWSDWKKAGETPELAGAFGAVPPPLPG